MKTILFVFSFAVAMLLNGLALSLADTLLPVTTTVLDSQGHPVAGAKIYISQWEDNNPLYVRKTDSNGTFTWKVSTIWNQEPPVQCVVVAKGFAVGGAELKTVGDHTITLTPPMSIHGKVLDSNNHPVSGATVQVNCIIYNDDDIDITPPALKRSLTMKTDAGGNYRFDGLPRNDDMDVGLDDPRFLDDTSITCPAGHAAAPVLVASYGVQLVGRVLEPNGQQAAGIDIEADGVINGQDQGKYVLTEKTGTYRITGLPAGTYTIQVDPTYADYHARIFKAPAQLQITAVAAKTTHVPDIRLTRPAKK